MPDIRQWLEERGFGQYADSFEENDVDLQAVPYLTETQFEKLGVSIGHAAKIRSATAAALQSADATELSKPEQPRPDRSKPSTPDAERRQITVMFCDLVGSTALAETLDPEELREVMGGYQAACGAVIEHYGGHVAQYLGDGLMTYFGWPQAHEDDAERSIRSGLEIIEAIKNVAAPSPLEVHIGIATGTVVVGETGGGDASIPKLAVGETPNLAARIQGLAKADQIVIAPATHRLAGNAFRYEDLGVQALKGIVEPVHCWRVTRSIQFDQVVVEGLTPFVGRESELDGMEHRLAQVEHGRGHFVLLIGDPGVGKSRFLNEFRQRIGDRAAWAEGRAISFGQSMAFHPLIYMLRTNFAIAEDDSAEAIRDKVSTGMARVSPNLTAAVPMVQYLLGASSVDDPVNQMDPQVRRAETFDALLQLLMLAAERKPQVLVFEDLHWSDTVTSDFLRYILDSIPVSRVLVVATLRTGYPLPVDERSYVTHVTLQKFSSEESSRIAQAVLSAVDLPDELQAFIHDKAEGNPFFVEELVKSLGETGAIRRDGDTWVLDRPVDQTAVPDTVQGVLMSRIDRLNEEARRTLQLASVIGREFTQRLLARIGDLRAGTSVSLRELQAIELIHQKALYPELAFIFKHALTQDVAYGSLLVKRRRELHLRVAEAIEELYVERLGEHYAMIAHHYAAAQHWPKAAEYFGKAADHAAGAFAVHEAIALCERALAALKHGDERDQPDLAAPLHIKLAGLYMPLSDFDSAHTEYVQAAEIGHDKNDKAGEGAALAGMALASFFAHAFDRSDREAQQAARLGRDIDSAEIVAAAQCASGWVQAVTGNISEARVRFEESHQRSVDANADYFTSLSASMLSQLDNWQGNYARSVSEASEGVQVARKANHALPLLVGLWSTGLPHAGKGEYEAALAVWSEALALAEKVGDAIFRNRILNSLGWLYGECGSIERAIDLNERGLDFSQQRGDPEVIANCELNLGDAFLAKSDRGLAREFFSKAHAIVNNPSTSEWMRWRYSQHMFAGYGETCLALDEPAKANEFADQCLDLATRTKSGKYLARAWRLKGSIALTKLRREEAEESLRRALGFAEQIGNPSQLWRTHLALSQLYRDTRQVDNARTAARAARTVLDAIGQSLKTPELREAFEHSFLIRNAYQQTELN
jgi:class 3 adenylate cyclase/tetratricopeptide (TPR) repeat protein